MLKIVETKLPKEVFGQKVNLNLLAQAYYVYSNRNHIGLRSTKTRSEVNRTTKKLYKQKGTGGARHGSKRANLFVGGGVVFGPRPEKRVKNLSKGIKNAARITAFSAKSKDVRVVSGLDKVSKTSEVAKFLDTLKEKRYTILLSDKSLAALKFLRNLSNVRTFLYKNANAYNVLTGGLILIDEGAFAKKVSKEEKVSRVSKVKVTKKGVKSSI